MKAVDEAWEYETRKWASTEQLREPEVHLFIGVHGWRPKSKVVNAPGSPWFSMSALQSTLLFMLSHLYVENGDKVRRQVRGVPMGLECSPQLANLYGYAVESAWVVGKQPQPTNLIMRRYIDDIIIAGEHAELPGVGLPSEEEYGMKYKLTSDSPNSLIFLGVRFFKDERNMAHSVLHDRAVEYPIRIDRYPAFSTVANPAQ